MILKKFLDDPQKRNRLALFLFIIGLLMASWATKDMSLKEVFDSLGY